MQQMTFEMRMWCSYFKGEIGILGVMTHSIGTSDKLSLVIEYQHKCLHLYVQTAVLYDCTTLSKHIKVQSIIGDIVQHKCLHLYVHGGSLYRLPIFLIASFTTLSNHIGHKHKKPNLLAQHTVQAGISVAMSLQVSQTNQMQTRHIWPTSNTVDWAMSISTNVSIYQVHYLPMYTLCI